MDSLRTQLIKEKDYNRALQLDNNRLHDVLDEKDSELMNLHAELALLKQQIKYRKSH